jgi:hypothetical protein
MQLFAGLIYVLRWAVANKDLLEQFVAKVKDLIGDIEAHKAAQPAAQAPIQGS